MANRPSKCMIRGSINNDEYFYVRSIARPGETISSYRYKCRVGGNGANQAVAITRAGGTASFYGTIGKDGLWVKRGVGQFGLKTSGIIISDDPTGRALIQVADDGENSIILFPGANHSDLHEQRWKGTTPFPEASHLLLQNEIQWESTLYALKHAQNATVIFNPSPLPTREQSRAFPWEKVEWLIVNAGEARDLYTTLYDSQSDKSSSLSDRELLVSLASQSSFSTTNIVCTLGSEGVLAFLPAFHQIKPGFDTPPPIYLPAAKLQGPVRDTTGAGDCFTGYFVQGLMELGPDARVGAAIQENDITHILKTCVEAAGICVERPGTIDSIPSRVEVEARIAGKA